MPAWCRVAWSIQCIIANSRQLLNKAGCATRMSRLIDSRDQFIGQLLARIGNADFRRQQWRTRQPEPLWSSRPVLLAGRHSPPSWDCPAISAQQLYTWSENRIEYFFSPAAPARPTAWRDCANIFACDTLTELYLYEQASIRPPTLCSVVFSRLKLLDSWRRYLKANIRQAQMPWCGLWR